MFSVQKEKHSKTSYRMQKKASLLGFDKLKRRENFTSHNLTDQFANIFNVVRFWDIAKQYSLSLNESLK